MAQNPFVKYVEPDFIFTSEIIPDDPFFVDMWGLHNIGQSGGVIDADIDAPEAWELERGDGDVIVGIIDSGIDYTHPDLLDNIWINTGEIADNGIDDDLNGYIDDVRGYDFDGGDYMTVVATGALNTDEISIIMELTPDFETSDDVDRFLCDGSSGSSYRVRKRNNANGNVLNITLGNTLIASIAEATYSPYWQANQRNVLVVTGDSINDLTNVWLNGGHILDDDTTAWTAAGSAVFWVGSSYTPSSYFTGQIHTFAIFPFALTPLQVFDIQHRLQQEVNHV